MRVTTLLKKLLDVTRLLVTGGEFTGVGLVVDVRPRWRKARCGQCGRQAPVYDHRKARLWRHLSLGRTRLWLRYAPRRVHCKTCGVISEGVPWAHPGSRFTASFEELCAYLAQTTDKTSVTRLLGIDWRTVGAIVRRVVSRRLDPERLQGLRRIGIDEFSYRKRHRYLTTVVDHDRKRVVWTGEGKGGEPIARFFADLGPAGAQRLETVTMDMAEGFIQAVRKLAPQANIVFDRFHVQKLANEALDEVRREQVRHLGDSDAARAIKRSRWSLLKKPEDLTQGQRLKLSDIERENKPLFRAYLLKEALAEALSRKQPGRAGRELKRWIGWAARSHLKPFRRLSRTIRRYLPGILAYVKERLTNGLVEGFNGKTRMIARRAFGFHTAAALAGMIMLCCGGITLEPPLP